MFDDSIKILTKPREAFAEFKTKANKREAVLILAWFYGVLGLIIGLFIALAAYLFSSSPLAFLLPAGFTPIISLAAVILVPVFLVIGSIFLYAFSAFLSKIVADLLGGKASFTEWFYVSAKINLLVFFGLALDIFIRLIPSVVIRLAFDLISLLYGAYLIYLSVILTSEIAKLSVGKSILAIVIASVLFIVALVLFFILIGVFMGIGKAVL